MTPNLWIKVGIDNLFDHVMPDITEENMSYWQSKNPIRWVETQEDKDNFKMIILFVGEQGNKVVYGMNSAIAQYAYNGSNVIVDYIAYDKSWFTDLQRQLKGLQVYYIKVDISLEMLENREASRATSPKGHARSHYHTVHDGVNYDFVVNTEQDSAEQIALKIKQFIEQKK